MISKHQKPENALQILKKQRNVMKLDRDEIKPLNKQGFYPKIPK
jgi:uncharacterized protein YcgL (UPF0745 family)